MKRVPVQGPCFCRRLAGLVLALTLCLGSACQREATESVASPPSSASATPWLSEVAAELGVDFEHTSGARGDWHMPEMTGPGLALFDADGDGALDLYLVNGNTQPDSGKADGESRNRLFKQQSEGRFVDVTDEAGVGDEGFGMGVAVGDIDNDGSTDLYVANYGADRLYRNEGHGTFRDVTAEWGLDVGGWSSSAVFCDVDRDGWLDLYVAQYVVYEPAKVCQGSGGERDYCGPDSFSDRADVLLRNREGKGFEDVSQRAGIASVEASGLGVVCADFNADGWPDLYVADDGDPNQYWINQGDGTFRDGGIVMGVAVNAQGRPEAGMGVVAADLDGDLDLDLFMSHLAEESNTFYRNLGAESGFEDETFAVGLAQPSVPFTGFGTVAIDFEHDGDLDLVVVNGRVKRGPVLGEGPFGAYLEPDSVYVNRGQGRFAPGASEFDAFTSHLGLSRGAATGDLDGDGDLDLVIADVEGSTRVYRNDAPKSGHWLIVETFHPEWHRLALGSQVTVRAGGRSFLRLVTAGSSYLSSSDARAHFGLGEVTAVDSIRVDWPDGSSEEFGADGVDRVVRLVWGEGNRS